VEYPYMGKEELVEMDAEEGLSWLERISVVVEELDGAAAEAKGKLGLDGAHAGWWGSTLGRLEVVVNGVFLGIATGEVDGVGKDAEEGMGHAPSRG
jgi:hypothetical protein